MSKAAVITWDGEGGDGLWGSVANWVGDVLPSASDDVVLDNSSFPGNYTIMLPGGNVPSIIRSLVISPAEGNSITLILPPANTADPGLSITGPGDALILNDRAVLRNSSGSLSGQSLVISNIFRINNGGRYIHNTNRGNAAIVSQLSTAAGTELGVFEYDVPAAGYVVSLSGRTYGTLVLSANARSSAVSYTGNGVSPLHIGGDLCINTGVNFSIGMTGDFVVHRNLIQTTASSFDLQTSGGNNFIKVQGDITIDGRMTESGNGLPILELNGSVNQNISVTGSLLNQVGVKINNSAGVTLLAPLMLPYNLQLANGKIRTNNINILALADNATYTGGSSLSFVDGPMQKTGDDDFSFPVGKGSIYAPVTLAGGSGASATDQFTAEYLRANPQSTFGINYETTALPGNIDHISYVEYWSISSNTGAGVFKFITLKVNCESFCKDFNSLLIAGYDNVTGIWKNLSRTATTVSAASCTGYTTGTITSVSVNGFKQFTLASDEAFLVNPLPVQIVSFDVRKINDSKVVVSWEMASVCAPATRFDVEWAGERRHFSTIATQKGNERNFFYMIEHSKLSGGINYYRLKMTDAQGMVSHSKTVFIHNSGRDFYFVSISPVRASSTINFSVVSSRPQAVELWIVDMTGRILVRQHQQLQRGVTSVTLFSDKFSTGIYQLCGINSEGQKNSISFFIG